MSNKRAEAWQDVLWKGKLEIVTKGREFAAVRLADACTGKVPALVGDRTGQYGYVGGLLAGEQRSFPRREENQSILGVAA